MRARPATTVLHGALALALGVVTPSLAQEVRYFACAEVRFFAAGPCGAPGPVASPVPPLAQAVPPPEETPLFPPETLAPDTPPLLAKVLEEPTVENARAFVAWQTRRQQRVQEVQQLLKAIAAESPRSPGGP